MTDEDEDDHDDHDEDAREELPASRLDHAERTRSHVLDNLRLTEEQHSCIREIYAHLTRHGTWPQQRTFAAALNTKLGIALPVVSNGIERLVHGRTEPNEAVRLVLPALHFVGSPEALSDIELVLSFLRLLGEVRTGEPDRNEIEGREAIKRLGLSAGEALRLEQHLIASGSVFIGTGIHKTGLHSTTFPIIDRYLGFDRMLTLDDVLRDLYRFYAPFFLPPDGYGEQRGRDYDLRTPPKFGISYMAGMTDFAGTSAQQMRETVAVWLDDIEGTAQRLGKYAIEAAADPQIQRELLVLQHSLHRLFADLSRLHREIAVGVARRHLKLLTVVDGLARETEERCVAFKRDFLYGRRVTSVPLKQLEQAYADSRDCTITLRDVSNMRSQLATFVGWKASADLARSVTILFVVAQPNDEARIRVDRELRDVIETLGHAKYGSRIKCDLRLAARPEELVTALHQTQPQVLHFSGHGVERLGRSKPGGLIFENRHGNAKTITGSSLATLLAHFKLRLLVMNACFSDHHVPALLGAVPAVVGMRDAILDQTAIDFAVGLYEALGFGRTLQESFGLARARLSLLKRRGVSLPKIHGRPPAVLDEHLIGEVS